MFNAKQKLLSQNFLGNKALISRLIISSGILWHDTVLEIGAGNGNITEGLLSVSGKVIAVEIDKALADQVSNRFGNNKALEIVCGNFLDFELPKEPYRVFSNIPFSITGEIVKRLLFSDNPPNICDLIVQKEAAEKFMVNQGKKSMLSILFYPWFEMKISHIFKRTDFRPIPSVDLCLLQIVKRSTPLVHAQDTNEFRNYVVYKYTKCRSVGEWQAAQWVNSYTRVLHSRGSFVKWQRDQRKLKKIHRTRTDRNWKKIF